MELFLFRPTEYARLYNCSKIDIGQVPLENRRHPIASIIIIALCAIYYLLYFPCIFSIIRQMRRNSCYQIIFYISITDVSILWILGFLHGWLSLQGAIFCSYPTPIYVIACLSMMFWIAESSAGLLLATVRCIEIAAPKMANRLFGNNRTFYWLAAISLYGLYRFFYQPPGVFSAVNFQWFFNPFDGYMEDGEGNFENRIEEIHDLSVAIISPLLYILFALSMTLFRKRINFIENNTGQLGQLSFSEKMISLQIFLISLLNTLALTLFVLMQHIDFGFFWLNYVSHYAWFHIHGFPPVIYLTLNKTIRNEAKQLLLYKILRLKKTTTVQALFILQQQNNPTRFALSSSQQQRNNNNNK